MFGLLRRRPSPALIVAITALVLSMGGVSYGLATGSIDSREIKNNTVRTQDIRNGHVRQFDIRNGAVRSRHINGGTVNSDDVADDSLTGADINESTLGQVPSASTLGGIPVGRSFASSSNADINDYPSGAALVSVNLPAGRYSVVAQLSHDNDGAAGDTTCTLSGGGLNEQSEFSESAGAAEPDGMSVSFTGIADSAAAFTAAVSCPNNGANDDILSRAITAVRVSN